MGFAEPEKIATETNWLNFVKWIKTFIEINKTKKENITFKLEQTKYFMEQFPFDFHIYILNFEFHMDWKIEKNRLLRFFNKFAPELKKHFNIYCGIIPATRNETVLWVYEYWNNIKIKKRGAEYFITNQFPSKISKKNEKNGNLKAGETFIPRNGFFNKKGRY